VPPPPEEVHKTLAARNSEVEQLVFRAYSKLLKPRFPSGMALAAVGGFGRREVFPHADVELMFLVEFENQIPLAEEALSPLVQTLWAWGSRPSHSVHTVAECVTEQEDHAELNVSLLDGRLVAGDAALFAQLRHRFDELVARRGSVVAQQLAGLCQERHAKFQ